ncbi:hypothetical protein R50912_16185 [Paenibacillus sp. FSL R5-0912]|nr:hypothetical protein R50912_16185 [Paenibacillus sp. FSL R5-0912]
MAQTAIASDYEIHNITWLLIERMNTFSHQLHGLFSLPGMMFSSYEEPLHAASTETADKELLPNS